MTKTAHSPNQISEFYNAKPASTNLLVIYFTWMNSLKITMIVVLMELTLPLMHSICMVMSITYHSRKKYFEYSCCFNNTNSDGILYGGNTASVFNVGGGILITTPKLPEKD